MLPGLTLTVVFRRSGWRWPLGSGDHLQVWDQDWLVAELPAEFVLDVLRHHLAALGLQRALGHHLAGRPKPMLPSGAAALPQPRLRQASGRRLRGR